MAHKKEWSDLESSKIDVVFDDLSAIERRHPRIKIGDDSTLGITDIRERILSSIGFISRRPKNALLNVAEIEKTSVDALCSGLDRIAKQNTNVCAEFIKVQDNPNVRFWHSEVKKGKLYPPRMIIDLSREAIQPNESVMINTGYVVRTPQATQTRVIEKDRIVKDVKSIVKQPNYVIIPLISSSTAHLIPSIYVRDSDDTGLLTVNFTLVSGNPGKVQVVFNAYLVDRMLDGVQLVDPEPNASLFKPKDGLSGRYVKNPKIKIRFNEMSREADGSYSFPTFNPLVKPSVTYDKQRVVSRSACPIFLCSRRREWYNPDLLTLSGLLVNSEKYIAPKVLLADDISKNTHCMVALKNRVTLISDAATANLVSLKLLNGAFIHLPNYADLSSDYHRLVFTLQALASGYSRCQAISKRLDVPLSKVLRVFDYHRTVNEATIRDYLELDDASLFASRVGAASAYSVVIDKTLNNLATWYSERESELEPVEPPTKKLRST